MKINIYHTTTHIETRTVECTKHIEVPGWVWPFNCTKCDYDIETEMQVIAVPEGEPHTILHYHVECWEKVQEK